MYREEGDGDLMYSSLGLAVWAWLSWAKSGLSAIFESGVLLDPSLLHGVVGEGGTSGVSIYFVASLA